MYRVASRNQQHAVSAEKLKHAPACEEQQTPEEERDNLKGRLFALRKRLSEARNKEERYVIGRLIYDTQQLMHEIRPKRKCRGAGSHFIDVARERLTRFQYQQIMAEAVRRAEAEEAVE